MQLAVAFGASGLFSGAGLMKIGMLAATAVGGFMMRKKVSDKEAGKLNDLKVSSSSYGKGIPIVWGTMRCTGNMIWSTDFDEEVHYFDSKGNDITGKKKDSKKGTKHFMYFANFGMGMCEGPVDELLRIWADSNLIYDKYNPTGYTDDNGIFHEVVRVGFSRHQADGGGKGAGNKAGKGKGKNGDTGQFSFRWYSGSESQGQEQVMLTRGGGKPQPAYRGLAYLFFEHFQLEDFGNRTPTITAEVVVKRQRQPDFGFLRNLIDWDPTNATIDNDGGWVQEHNKCFVDPVNHRLVSVGRPRNTAVYGTFAVRVYDLVELREIKQKGYKQIIGPLVSVYSQIHQLQGIVPSTCADIIGTHGTGSIIARAEQGANGFPIMFLDPTTLTCTHTFGTGTADFQNSSDTDKAVTSPPPWYNNIGGANFAVPMLVVNPEDKSTKPYGGVLNFWEGPMIFDDKEGPKEWVNFDAQFDYMIPGFPKGTQVDYWLRQRFGNQQVGALWHGNKVMFSHATSEDTHDSFIVMGDPFAMVGPDCIGVFWQRGSGTKDRNGLFATRLNKDSGLEEWTLKVTDRTDYGFESGFMHQAPLISSNFVEWIHGRTVFQVDFREQTVTSFDLPDNAPVMIQGQCYYSPKACIIMTAINPDVAFNPARSQERFVMAYLDKMTQTPASIKQICLDICDHVNLPPEQVDVSKLNDNPILGYILENPASGRSIIEELSKVYMFDVVESDRALKFVSRGQSSITTINQDRLAPVAEQPDEQLTNEYFKETRHQEIDLPQRVDVSFVNSQKEYENATQGYARPHSPMAVMQTKEKLEINLPIAMTVNDAKQLAQIACLSIWSERITHEFTLPWEYIIYDPTDVVTVTLDDGYTMVDRLIKMDIGADYSLQAAGVAQVAGVYTSDINGMSPGGVIPNLAQSSPNVRPVVLDIPFQQDADAPASNGASFNLYYGIAADGPYFKGGEIDQKLKDAGSWGMVGANTSDLIWGTVIGTVPPPPHGPFATDDSTVLTLVPGWDFYDRYAFNSIPDANWPSTDNCILIGNEIIYFKNVTVNADKTLTISTLIRAARGTEEASYLHKATEKWFLGNQSSFNITDEPLEDLNKLYSFRATSPATAFGLTLSTDLTITGAPQRPYGPTDFRRTANTPSTNDVTIDFKRRTRLGGAMVNGTGNVPLNETSEKYEVFIMKTAYDPAVGFSEDDSFRSYEVITPSIVYTAAQRTADGNSGVMPIHVVAFQLSDLVGRGFAGWATLYPVTLT